eukprot:TRINITY_DN519_c0_g1_i1.p1 TRINITY_DN519_c0_g1~~TRINITY_DN519_c0_g1_i1.p1  ORF type:complete len:215 (-),score=97.93 TRINITY_DN519_c0_g1_i1:50-637(-)
MNLNIICEKLDSNPKIFQALLNGTSKFIFEKDQSISIELLQEQLFSNPNLTLNLQEVELIFESCCKTISQAAFENWEPAKFEAFLKTTAFTEVEQELLCRFWRIQRPKVIESLRKQAILNNNSLNLFEWRIDVKSKSRYIQELNEPTAIVELTLARQQSVDQNKLVRFEMNRQQLKEVISQLDNLQQLLTINNQN